MSSLLDDTQSLLKGTGIIFTGRLTGRGLGLLGQILLVRSLSPENFGLLALGYTIVFAIAQLYSRGIAQGVTRFLSKPDQNQTERDAVISSAFSFFLLMAFCFGILLTVSGDVISNLMDISRLSHIILWFFPVLFLFPFGRLFIGILRAEERSIAPVLTQDVLSKGIAILAFIVVSAWATSFLGAITYWNGALFVTFLGAGFAALRHLHIGSISIKSIRYATARSLWEYSWPLVLSTSFAMLLSYVDIIMIGYYLSEAEVGLYRAIQPLRQVTLFLLTSVVFLYLPVAARYFEDNQYQELNRLYSVVTKWVTLGTFPFVIIFAVFSEDVIRVFFTGKYAAAAPTLSVLIVGMFLRVVGGPTGETVKAINKTKVEFYASISGLITNIAINIIFIPWLGIIGAAIGASIGFLIFNTVELAVIYHVTGSHPFTLNTVKPLLPALVISGIVWYSLREYQLGLLSLLLVGIFISTVTLVSIPLTNSFDDIDVEILKSEIPWIDEYI